MAVSADGYVARGPDDDMSWLGSTDKAIFRILTGVEGHIGVGANTAKSMPADIPGRNRYLLSRTGPKSYVSWGTLERFAFEFPHGWIIGGQKLALAALTEMPGAFTEVHLCRSTRFAFPDKNKGIPDLLTGWLYNRSSRSAVQLGGIYWQKEMTTNVLDVEVECWRRRIQE